MSRSAAAVAVAAMWGLTLRARQDLLHARGDERRDIARELHDDIAHHVTGIIVTAQAAELAAQPEPAVRAALAQIEQAAGETLESMRTLVGVLRSVDDGGAPRRPNRWPGDLEELVERFQEATGVRTTLRVEAKAVPETHRFAARRVTQEALTNVRKHAVDARHVEVSVIEAGAVLRVGVADDGQPAPRASRRAAGSASRASANAPPRWEARLRLDRAARAAGASRSACRSAAVGRVTGDHPRPGR